MLRITEKKNCCGCFSCYNVCPKNCINMVVDNDGFIYPHVNEHFCINCNLCNKVCPMDNYNIPDNKPLAFGAINKDEKIRMFSSSGGVFFSLCKHIIQQNGVVFGAAFDDEFNVVHRSAETIDECKQFMGSKYIQSYIGNSYYKVKEFLNNKRIVLFSGTPCQIAGLVSFLGEMKDCKNLITQDIVCHSVPSQKKWEEYKQVISKDKQIISVQFRNKDTGWMSGSFLAKFSDGSEYKELYAKTDYMSGFLRGDYSRPACYKCKFSRIERQSDITLGDFWGVEGLYPKMFDNKGTSLVLINTKRGKQLFRIISKDLRIKKVKIKYAVKYNPAVANREELFKLKKNSRIKLPNGSFDILK